MKPSKLHIALVVVLLCISSALYAQDIPKFSEVDNGFYRGGQPTKEDFEYLKGLGIKTVIYLRDFEDVIEWESKFCREYKMNFINMPVFANRGISKEDANEFLQIVLNPKNKPVFVHCKHGSNRTGAMVAAYRIIYQRWSPKKAYREALSFGLNQLHFKFKKFILKDAIGWRGLEGDAERPLIERVDAD